MCRVSLRAHFVSYICRYACLFLVAVGKLFVFDIKPISMLVLSSGDCREWAIIKFVYIFYLVKETQMNSVISIDWKDFFKTGSIIIIFLAIQLIKSNWVLIIILSSLKFIVAVITWERGHFNWNSAFPPGFAPKIWKENNGKGVIDFIYLFINFSKEGTWISMTF